MSQKDELKALIEERRAKLKLDYERLKNDASDDAKERLEKVKSKLDELSGHLADGWDNLTESVSRKLNEWLLEDKDDK